MSCTTGLAVLSRQWHNMTITVINRPHCSHPLLGGSEASRPSVVTPICRHLGLLFFFFELASNCNALPFKSPVFGVAMLFSTDSPLLLPPVLAQRSISNDQSPITPFHPICTCGYGSAKKKAQHSCLELAVSKGL